MIKKLTLALICVFGLSTPALAGTIQVNQAWAITAEEPGGYDVLLHIENSGAAADQLYAVRTTIAGSAVLNVPVDGSGAGGEHLTMSALEVPAGQSVIFAEDSTHILLSDLDAPLNEGDTFTITLFFEGAGKIEAEVVFK